MIRAGIFMLACVLAGGAAQADDHVAADVIAQIDAMLADMQCEVDSDEIEAEDDGYELDDVFCADGQYDIELDADLNVVEKRKE